MLNKEQTSRTVRIIALIIAVSFVLSMIPLMGISLFSPKKQSKSSTPPTTATSTTSSQATSTSTNETKETTASNEPDSDKIRSMMSKGNDALQAKNYDKAAELFQNVLKLDSNNSTAQANLGVCEFLAGDKELSYSDLGLALEMDSKNPIALFYFAEAAKARKRRSEARRYYQKYLKLYPDGEYAAAAQQALEKIK